MIKWMLILAVSSGFFLALGCSSGTGNPISADLTLSADSVNNTQTHLWGYYDIYIDLPTLSAEAIPNRDAMYSANVVKFLNKNGATLKLKINGAKTIGSTAVDIDLDVRLSHPFPGMPQYNGYDVRGIFIGNGSATMPYNDKLKYAAYGSGDQVMYDYDEDFFPIDPYAGKVGNPDGYTRWWNPSEFITPNMFGYVPGVFSTPSYSATATLNPYKYFADGLTANGNLWTFMTDKPFHGRFGSGNSNSRNYYLRFPKATGMKFAYAVLACWKNIKPEDHPANASEAVALNCDVTSDLYYVDEYNNGGDFTLDLSIFDWDSHLSAGAMEDYKIIIDSTVLSTPYVFPASAMIPTGQGDNYFTYHAAISADNVTSSVGQQFWVIVEDQKHDYSNPFGFPNNCGDDPLAAYFRNDLFVSDIGPENNPPVIDSGVDGNAHPLIGTTEIYSVTAHDPDPGDTIAYKWTLTDQATGIPDPAFYGVPGNPDGTLSVDWSIISGVDKLKKYNISCSVTDNKSMPVPAITLTARIAYEVTITVTANPVWTDSGITLQPGDFATAHDAVGSWSWGGPNPVGPEGESKPDGIPDEWIPNGMHAQLIGYIGPVGFDPFTLVQGDAGLYEVGIGTVKKPGLDTEPSELWFGFNDDYSTHAYTDNYGTVDVIVLIE